MLFTDPPRLDRVSGIHVARDDLMPGGTKTRAATYLFIDNHHEIVYAGACQSVAQTALALAAKSARCKATVFVAARATRTPETEFAMAHGANVHEVRPGYLSVVKARAQAYCRETGALLAPLGFDLPDVRKFLASVASKIPLVPDEVWVAAGSGTLTRSLQLVWPNAEHHAVLFGKDCYTGKAVQHRHETSYGKKIHVVTPFPCHAAFDAKAWEICERESSRDKTVLFWNVHA